MDVCFSVPSGCGIALVANFGGFTPSSVAIIWQGQEFFKIMNYISFLFWYIEIVRSWLFGFALQTSKVGLREGSFPFKLQILVDVFREVIQCVSPCLIMLVIWTGFFVKPMFPLPIEYNYYNYCFEAWLHWSILFWWTTFVVHGSKHIHSSRILCFGVVFCNWTYRQPIAYIWWYGLIASKRQNK